jgi:hypothetical protein
MPRLTNLDDILFAVEEHPVFVSIPEKGGERRLAVPEKKAIVNRANKHVLGIVSRGYRLVSNSEALDLTYKCCRTLFPETAPGEWSVTTVDAPSTGGSCHIDLTHNSAALNFNAVMPEERPEVYGPFIRVTNSYNGLRALGFDIGFYRKVCKNGMIIPDTIIRFNFTHLRRDIGETIRFVIAKDRLAKLKATFTNSIASLRTCEVARAQFEPMVRRVLQLRPPKPLKPNTPYESDWLALNDHIVEMSTRYAYELGENAYAVFNVITEFSSRPPLNRCVHRDRNSLQRLAGSWLTSFNVACRKPDFSISKYLESMVDEQVVDAGTDNRPVEMEAVT